MCPEYGATVAIFPIDEMTLDYLRLTGRDESQRAAGRGTTRRRRGCSAPTAAPDAVYSETIELDLATIEPSLAGPKRPQDRVSLKKAKAAFQTALPTMQVPPKPAKARAPRGGARQGVAAEHRRGGAVGRGGRRSGARRARSRRRRHRRDHELHEHVESERDDRRRPRREEGGREGADAQAVGEEQPGAGLEGRHRVSRRGRASTPYLDQLGFNLVGYGCTTCIGNSGPLPDEVSAVIREKNLVVCSVLSGNRNFEGRIQQDVRANYLASPPLVVAYALAGWITKDLTTEPLGEDQAGKPGLS